MYKELSLLFLIINSTCVFAGNTFPHIQKPKSKQPDTVFTGSLPGFIYSYVDFDFNSTAGSNFNHFRGHSNVVSVGTNQLKLFKDVTGGLFIYHIDTTNIAHVLLNPNPQSLYRSDTANDTVLAHLMKPLNNGFFIDGGFGYGYNRVILNGKIYSNGLPPFKGNATYSFNNWLANATLYYQRKMKAFLISAFIQGLYTRSDVGNYRQLFTAFILPSTVAPLTTKVTYLIENINIRYQYNNLFTPFVSAGLVQVADYNQSRSAVTGIVTGSLPQLALNRDGFRIGGGFGVTRKNLAARLEYRYYRATHQFHSDQFIVNLTYLLD